MSLNDSRKSKVTDNNNNSTNKQANGNCNVAPKTSSSESKPRANSGTTTGPTQAHCQEEEEETSSATTVTEEEEEVVISNTTTRTSKTQSLSESKPRAKSDGKTNGSISTIEKKQEEAEGGNAKREGSSASSSSGGSNGSIPTSVQVMLDQIMQSRDDADRQQRIEELFKSTDSAKFVTSLLRSTSGGGGSTFGFSGGGSLDDLGGPFASLSLPPELLRSTSNFIESIKSSSGSGSGTGGGSVEGLLALHSSAADSSAGKTPAPKTATTTLVPKRPLLVPPVAIKSTSGAAAAATATAPASDETAKTPASGAIPKRPRLLLSKYLERGTSGGNRSSGGGGGPGGGLVPSTASSSLSAMSGGTDIGTFTSKDWPKLGGVVTSATDAPSTASIPSVDFKNLFRTESSDVQRALMSKQQPQPPAIGSTTTTDAAATGGAGSSSGKTDWFGDYYAQLPGGAIGSSPVVPVVNNNKKRKQVNPEVGAAASVALVPPVTTSTDPNTADADAAGADAPMPSLANASFIVPTLPAAATTAQTDSAAGAMTVMEARNKKHLSRKRSLPDTTAANKKQRADSTVSQARNNNKRSGSPTGRQRKGGAKQGNSEIKEYKTPTEHDVLLGRGGRTNHHPGNQRYLRQKDAIQERYMAASKQEKTTISQELVDAVQDWGGRFLKMDDATQQWYEVPNIVARKKASQTLREINTAEERAAKRAKYSGK